MRTVVVGPISFCVESKEAASILEKAKEAYECGDTDLSRQLRMSAARIENGA